MRDFFHWMNARGFWKKSRAAHRSVRRSAIAWGSAIALTTGCVAAWGATTPTAEHNTAGSSASQAENNAQSNTAGDAGWQDGPRGHDEPQGDDTSTDGGTPDSTPGTDDSEQDGQADTDQGAQDETPGETPGATTPAPAPVEPAPAPAPAPTGGWPTDATTGVPAGANLTQMNGLTVTTNGAVIDAKLVKGDIIIKANNVTIKNSKVEGRIQIRPPYTGLMVQSTEIAGPGTAWAAVTEGIGYANFTCDRCDIHGWGKGAMMDANVTISNSWIHDMPVTAGSHNEAILSLGGPNYTIVNNRLDSGSAGNFTASLAFLNQWNSFTNTLVKGNLFNGGGYCVYAGGEAAHNDQYPSSNVRFLDNTFGTDANPKCGYYGAAIAWDSSGPGNQWSGNVMSNGGEVRAPSAG